MSMASLRETEKNVIKNLTDTDDVYLDPEKTKKVQEGRIEHFKWKGTDTSRTTGE